MKIYNENKTQELENVDLTKGCLKNEKIISKHYEAVSEITVEQQLAELNSKGAKVEQIKGKWYKVVKEYESGGKDVEEIVIIPAVEAYDDYEDIQIYIPYTEEELEKKEIEKLRALRRSECFTVINRGQLWYSMLTQEELVELNEWYHNWLNVTDTKIVPEKPEFLNNPIRQKRVITESTVSGKELNQSLKETKELSKTLSSQSEEIAELKAQNGDRRFRLQHQG